VSAILVYLSQEARLHSLLVAITVAHANALVDVVWPRGRPRLAWVLYALLGVAGLWTYAPYGAALAGHWAFYALYGRRERGAVSRFVAAQVVIAASLLPWLPTLQAVTARVSASLVSRPQDLRPLRAEQVAVAALSAPAGLSYARWTFQSGLTALTALGWGVGLWCAFRGSVRRAEQGGRLWPLLVVPVAAYLMTPTPRVHEFELKHVVFLVPFALLACAAAVVRPTGRRWIGALLGGVLAVLNLGDALCYLSPGFEKEPWRSIVAEIKGRSTPGDFVMVNPSYAQAPYRVYGRRGPPVVGAPERFDEAMITQLRPDFRRVWLVEVASRVARPLDVPGEWLDRHWRPAGEARVYPGYLGVVLLRLYERHTAATPE
jgi:hypothetical protein